MKHSIFDEINRGHIVPTVEAESGADGLEICRALYLGGINCAEIMFRTDAAEETIRLVRKELPDMIAGAGTVLNLSTAEKAMNAGAEFIVAPGFDPELSDWCREKAMNYIPGVATASEITIALKNNLRYLKFFPAEAAGGIPVLKALSGPFKNAEFLVTGGISFANMKNYLDLNNVIGAGGSFITPAELIRRRDWKAIEENARAAVEQIGQQEM